MPSAGGLCDGGAGLVCCVCWGWGFGFGFDLEAGVVREFLEGRIILPRVM